MIDRRPAGGWLVLLGGGEFSYGDTEEMDRLWLEKAPEGKVGFIPAASGSDEYGGHFAAYLSDFFGREAETIPLYRARDGRRGKNVERLKEAPILYLGGGVTDHLLDAVLSTPALEAMEGKLEEGGMIVAMAAAASAVGTIARSVFRSRPLEGLGWLSDTAVETNFSLDRDRRVRKLQATSEIRYAIGLSPESALFLGPQGAMEVLGEVYRAEGPEGDWVPFETNPIV